MKLREQLLFRCLAAAGLLLGLFGAVLLASSFDLQITRERTALETRSDDLANSLESSAVNYALQGIPLTDDLLVSVLRQLDPNAGLCAPDGSSILNASSPMSSDGMTMNGQMLQAVRPVHLAGDEYHLLITADLSPLYASRSALLGGYVLIYLGFMLLFSVFMLATARSITRPIENLARISLSISEGALNQFVPEEGSCETIEMARSFNRMTHELTNRIERQKRFIADLTHEMKTPLTAMIGHADLIRSGRSKGEDAMISAHLILSEGKRLNALTARMIELILLGQEDFEPIPVSVQSLIEETADSLRHSAEQAGVTITTSHGGGAIPGDPVLLRSLLTNLTDNAIKSGAASVHIGSRLSGGYATLSVRDDGRGMDEESLHRITEPFYRVDKSRSRAQGGAGLGLSLCAEIARLHGSVLEFQSTPGTGTVVSLTLRGEEDDEA